jgi:hypothetical protein
MAGKYYRWSPYAYVLDNPIKLYDPNGLWPTRIHNKIIDQAFGRILNAQSLQILKDASKFTDRPSNQGPLTSYEHAMSSIKFTASEARTNYLDFISSQKASFIDAENTNDALFILGQAFHAIMDNSSPSHAGFQRLIPGHGIHETDIGGLQAIVNTSISEMIDLLFDVLAERDDTDPIFLDGTIYLGEVTITAESQESKERKKHLLELQNQMDYWIESYTHPNRLYEGNFGYKFSYWETHDKVKKYAEESKDKKSK